MPLTYILYNISVVRLSFAGTKHLVLRDSCTWNVSYLTVSILKLKDVKITNKTRSRTELRVDLLNLKWFADQLLTTSAFSVVGWAAWFESATDFKGFKNITIYTFHMHSGCWYTVHEIGTWQHEFHAGLCQSCVNDMTNSCPWTDCCDSACLSCYKSYIWDLWILSFIS